MATTQKWVAPENIATALTTELNSLADGSLSSLSAAIDNATDLYQYMALELTLASLNPTGVPYVEVYLFKSVDGTNYEDGSASLTQCLAAIIPVTTGSSAKESYMANIVIPPLKFKLAAKNATNVAFAAANNILSYRRYNEQSV